MPRPKGSKNKKRQPRIKLPPGTVILLTKLSEDSGLPFNKVLDDAVVEGAAELRSETYKGLIDFNLNRRGKVYREREPEKIQQPGKDSPSLESQGTDTERFPVANIESRYEGPALEDSGLPGGKEGQSARIAALDGSVADDFQERARQTIEHITNHPPFLVPSGDSAQASEPDQEESSSL